MPELPDLSTMLADVVSRGGSDLHLVHGAAPVARIGGDIGALPYSPLTSDSIRLLLEPLLLDAHKETMRRELRVNLAHAVPGVGRFRVNVYMSQGTIGAAIRVVPSKILPLASLGLPPVVASLALRKSGIILVTGATGSGKSTTLAAMLEHVNQNGHPGKIVTIEDPIETQFRHGRSIFVQREVGVDTPSFHGGIMDSLRQDPDVICIGELRDEPAIRAALIAAETGHLVLSTLHTRGAAKTAQRLITAVPNNDQESMREQLAATLEAVISLELLPRADAKGQVVACEVMVATSATRQMIRENKIEAINDAILTGGAVGMVSKDASIRNLYAKGAITKETALEHVRNPELLR